MNPRTHLAPPHCVSVLLAWLTGATCLVQSQTVLHVLTDNDPEPTGFGGYQQVGGAGDVNGDGVPDIIVGATENNPIKDGAGFAQVFSGADGSLLHHFAGIAPDSWFGFSVDAAGDVDLDGFEDLIVGAPGEAVGGTLHVGSATVLSGATGATIHKVFGDDLADLFGYDVAGVGDANGDGYADFGMSSHQDDNNGGASGSVRVFSGKTGLPLFTASGDASGDQLGWAISGADDVNGDGLDDVIAGAIGGPTASQGSYRGYVRVFSGHDGTILFTKQGDNDGDLFGYDVGKAGDVNRDGYGDFMVGAPSFDGTTPGYVRVFSGADGATLFTLTGTTSGDYFGTAVAGVGDTDGDNIDDLLIGAKGVRQGTYQGGAAYVYSGADRSLIASFGGNPFQNTGRGVSVAGAGDVDRNGLSDLIIGSAAEEVLVATAVTDIDLDGVHDEIDQCQHSDTRPTVVIDGCDSGVPNRLLPSGCSIADLIDACAATADGHGAFVSCVAQLMSDLQKADLLDGRSRGAIQRCAARASVP